ncbi:MAG: cupin domain-containing protein [Pseudomonadota bacterium]
MSHPGEVLNPVEPERHLFPDDGSIPNNPRLPFLVYPEVLGLDAGDLAAAFETVFAANHWDRTWRNGIYPFPHYHSTAHEALGICRGEARVRFGGSQGVVMTVRAGDAVVLPAGVGHENLGSSEDLLVVGAYPPGPSWDLCTGKPGEHENAPARIAAVPLPPADPLFGEQGPLIKHWQSA